MNKITAKVLRKPQLSINFIRNNLSRGGFHKADPPPQKPYERNHKVKYTLSAIISQKNRFKSRSLDFGGITGRILNLFFISTLFNTLQHGRPCNM